MKNGECSSRERQNEEVLAKPGYRVLQKALKNEKCRIDEEKGKFVIFHSAFFIRFAAIRRRRARCKPSPTSTMS